MLNKDWIGTSKSTYATFEAAIKAREKAEKQYYPKYRRKTS